MKKTAEVSTRNTRQMDSTTSIAQLAAFDFIDALKRSES